MIVDKINALGFLFDQNHDVKGRISISDLFPKSKPRCGIYLLNFSDDTFYIGQAVDVVRRFAQHRKNYNNILKLWFQTVPKSSLNEIEQHLIKEAELSGLLLTNKTFVSNVIGETDLDLVITPQEQTEWLEENKSISNDGFRLYDKIDLKYKMKYRQNFENLQKQSNYEELKQLLSIYISKCLPATKKTEMSFWSLSCMPTTNLSSWPRFFCMNINAMEVFVLGLEKKTKIPFGFLVLTNRFITSPVTIKKLEENYKSLEVENSNYRAAGTDQITLHFRNLQELKTLLINESEIIDSIKEMNLRLMRKGGTIYSQFHCFDLVNEIFNYEKI